MRSELNRLLRPQSIAVFGGRFAEAVVRQCDLMDYAGDIWPVHPEREQILGRPCVRSAADLPSAPDAAFIGVNRTATIPVVRLLARQKAGGAICYASGFKEADAEGADLQAELVAAAGDMPLLGPNCYGFINYLDGALLWPDLHGGKRIGRGVALVTQSSNVGVNLTMSQRGLPLAYLITVGNQAMVGLHDVLRALCDDERVTAIGMYIEGLSDASAFAATVNYACAKGVPIVVMKAGRTESAQLIALSHTASLAGSDATMDALFDRLGVARVDSIPVLLETLKILHLKGPLTGRHIASLSCSGGEASIMSDSARHKNLYFKPFTESDRQRIRATVNPLVSISNPFDYHTFDWGNGERLEKTFTAVMQSGFDLTCLVLDFPRGRLGPAPEWDIAWQALANAAAASGHRGAVLATLAEGMPEEQCERLMSAGLTPLLGVDDALSAMEAAAFIGETRPGPLLPQCRITGEIHTLDEARSKQLLKEFDIPLPQRTLCRDSADAVDFWRQVGRPIALKAVSESLLHKTERGAVKLNLDAEHTIAQAFDQLAPVGDGVLAEVMITDGVAELIIGAARDPVIGVHMIVGAGGILTELLRDSTILLLPTDREEIERAVLNLRCAPLLQGWRGAPAADFDAIIDTVLNVQRFVLAHKDTLQEIDINPLIVCARHHGAFVVDATISLIQEGVSP